MIKYYGEANAQLSWCPTHDCKYTFEFNEGDSPLFNCQDCKKSYCLDCGIPYHEGKSCEEY